MAVARVGSLASTTIASASTSWTVATATPVVLGELLVVAIAPNDNGVVITRTGWTKVVADINSGTTAMTLSILYKVADAGDVGATSFVFTLSTSEVGAAIFGHYTGHDATTPMDVTAVSSNSGGSTSSAPAATGITTVTDGAYLIGVIMPNATSVTVTTTPSPLTEILQTTSQQGISWGEGTLATAGATGTLTYGFSGSNPWIHGIIAIRPAASGGTTPVSSDRAASWAVRQTVASERAASWSVRSITASDRSASWAVRQTTMSDRGASWSVRQAVAADRVASWAVRQSLVADRGATWNVAARVQSDRALSWAIRQVIQSDRQARWDVRSLVTVDRTALWSARALVASDRLVIWNVASDSGLSAVWTDRAVVWDTRAPVASDRVASWAARALVMADRELSWQVRSLVQVDRELLWRVLLGVASVRDARWAVRGMVLSDRVVAWDVVSDTFVRQPTQATLAPSETTVDVVLSETTVTLVASATDVVVQ